MPDGPEYLIRLRPVRDPVAHCGERPVTVRLRLFLKVALRSFGLRCVTIEEVPPDVPIVAGPTEVNS